MSSRRRTSRFTERGVRSIQPEGERFIVWGPHGLGLRVHPSGRKTWIYCYRFSGRARMMTLGNCPPMSPDAAREAHLKAVASRREGIDPGLALVDRRQANLEAPTFADLVDRFDAHYLKSRVKERTRREYLRLINRHVYPRWKNRKAREIRRRDVVGLVDDLACDRGVPVAAARTLAAVRKCFNWAVSRELLEYSPAVGVESPDPRRMRQRSLSDEEISHLFSALHALDPMRMGPAPRLAIFFTLATGARPGEVSGASWAEVNLKERFWTIPAERTKNGRQHRVPLSGFAMDVLAEAREGLFETPWVFPGAYARKRDEVGPMDPTTMAQSIRRNLKALRFTGDDGDFQPWCPHDLRRTCASGLARLRVPPRTIDRVLNHLRPRIERTYDTHSYDDEAREALELWGRHLEGLRAEGRKELTEAC